MSINNESTSARDSFEYLIRSLGAPTFHNIESLKNVNMSSGHEASWIQVSRGDTGTFHPVFNFGHHFISNDSYVEGYTTNPSRGDHMSIPGYTEDGQIAVIDISFHKGHTSINVVTFDAVPTDNSAAEHWNSKYAAALAILKENETR